MGPAFNRMWAASLISNLSDGVLMAAAPLLAISLTDNTVLISAIGATVMLPWLLFAIPIGAMVDRIDRRFILASANAIRANIVGGLALAIATNAITIYMLIVAGFIIGTCEVAADIKFGISYLYHHKILRRLVLTTSFIGVCYSMGTATIVLFMIEELDLPKALFGLVLTIQGIGELWCGD